MSEMGYKFKKIWLENIVYDTNNYYNIIDIVVQVNWT